MSRSLRASAPPPSVPPPGPVEVIRPDPEVWRLALAEAGGDPRRCRPQPDGSVLVRNPR